MLDELKVIEGRYFEDLLAQPAALKDTWDGFERPEALLDLAGRLRGGEFQRILLTGMGGSFHALHPLNCGLIDHGIASTMVETSELVHYQTRLLMPKTLLIAVSQSGESAEMARLTEVNPGIPMIAVTNTPESNLAKNATATLVTRAGREFSVSSKTYVTTLMMLAWLGDTLWGQDAEASRLKQKDVSEKVAAYLRDWKKHVADLADRLSGIRSLFLVGRGASLAAAGAGALMIKESDHFHDEGMSSAAFRHGPFEMLSGEVFVAVFSGDEKTRRLNEGLWADIRHAGGQAELIGERSEFESFRLVEHDPAIRPILEILPVQMITIALAALAGREAGKFERATKITKTE